MCGVQSEVYTLNDNDWGLTESPASVGPMCFIKNKISTVINLKNLGSSMAPSADKLYEDADFISSSSRT